MFDNWKNAGFNIKGLQEFGMIIYSPEDLAAMRNRGIEPMKAILTNSQNIFDPNYINMFPGAEELFAALQARNIPWAIVTNKPYKLAAKVQRQLPALLKSRLLVGGDSLAQRKPDPTPLWMTAHSMQVPANQCWYIGDAERDIEAGRRAGMQTVMCDFGYIGPDDKTELWGADLHISHFTDLIQYLD